MRDLRDVPPASTVDNMACSAKRDSELGGYLFVGHPPATCLHANRDDLFGREPRTAVLTSLDKSCPVLSHGITEIVLGRAEPQVVGVNTQPIVAGVTYELPSRDRSSCQFKSNSVRKLSPIKKAHQPVTTLRCLTDRRDIACPPPTAVRLPDPRPKPLRTVPSTTVTTSNLSRSVRAEILVTNWTAAGRVAHRQKDTMERNL